LEVPLAVSIKYSEVKLAVIAALRAGRFQHESRHDIEVKNLLAMGSVSPLFVERIIVKSDGTQHTSSPHHEIDAVDVHVIVSGGWYVKFYFIGDSDTMFISVHQ
jgi:hypothetical protein